MEHTDLAKIEAETILAEAKIHCQRIEGAIEALKGHYDFPISQEGFAILQQNPDHLARADQLVYRFSKAQDCMGAKLFDSLMLWMQEDTNRPFRDILNRLERLGILTTEEWGYLREIRNQIAHDYTFNAETERMLVNDVYKYRAILNNILNAVAAALHEERN